MYHWHQWHVRETLAEYVPHTLQIHFAGSSQRDKSVSSSHLFLVLRCEASHVALGGARGGAGVRGGSGARIRGSSRGMGTRGSTTEMTRLQVE